YTEAKASATITTTVAAGATCEQQRRAIAAKDATGVTATDLTRPLGLAWYLSYSKDTRRIRVACRAIKTGAVAAACDDPGAAAQWTELEPVLAAMIAARQ